MSISDVGDFLFTRKVVIHLWQKVLVTILITVATQVVKELMEDDE